MAMDAPNYSSSQDAHRYGNEATPLINRSEYWETYLRYKLFHKIAMSTLAFLLILGMIVGIYLLFLEDEERAYFALIKRPQWTRIERKIDYAPLALPVNRIEMVALEDRKCANEALSTPKCLRYVQKKHIRKSRDGSDISYNFIVDGNGTFYEGRGWREADEKGGFAVAALLGNRSNRTSDDVRNVEISLYNFLKMAVDKRYVVACFDINSDNSTVIKEVVEFVKTLRTCHNSTV
ncbi:unnamed protein product [Phyllotreta striolata]|uniref:Peptidoglycan recognition protein family domain-containing protein n=1 Tax=Phyllotreta striolata TaxID=444603 RepID=A0A9N9TK73_PHYSR|nr:unnamed protein product [Phyllotreta striolata]